MGQQPVPQTAAARGRGGSGRFNFSLSPTVASLVVLGLLLLLGWCFYMGFMIGRGQNPEEHLQKIAAIWQSRQEAGQNVQTAAQPAQTAGAGQTVQLGQPGAAQTDSTGIPVQQPGQPVVVPGQPVFRTQPAQGQSTQQAQSTGQGQQKAAKPVQQAQQSGPATYTFTYRMATVRSQQDAREEQTRYEGKGFRVSIRKSGNAWILQHTFNGTDEDAAQFLRDVKAAGLGEPMRVSRKKN